MRSRQSQKNLTIKMLLSNILEKYLGKQTPLVDYLMKHCIFHLQSYVYRTVDNINKMKSMSKPQNNFHEFKLQINWFPPRTPPNSAFRIIFQINCISERHKSESYHDVLNAFRVELFLKRFLVFNVYLS